MRLSWPVLAFLLTFGIFFAYGFRPECVLLLFFEFVLIVANLSALISSIVSLPGEYFHDRSRIFALISLVLACGAIALMFIFAPKVLPELETAGVETRVIHDDSSKSDYYVRIYTADQKSHALIFLIPPAAGSIPAVDQVCAALRNQGFTVLSYSRRDFDFPAIGENNKHYLVSPFKMRSAWLAFRKGTELKSANEQGKALEAERLADLVFLLPHIRLFANLAEETPVFLVGYGAGGSAAVQCAGSPDFDRRFPQVQGVIAVESRFWSSYYPDPPILPEIPAEASWHKRLRLNIVNWFSSLKAQRITGFSPPSPPGIPLLCLVSDWALANGSKKAEPYQALLALGQNANVKIATRAGAGPLDYCVYPLTHPLYSFLFPGAGEKENADPIGDTSGIIINFIENELINNDYIR